MTSHTAPTASELRNILDERLAGTARRESDARAKLAQHLSEGYNIAPHMVEEVQASQARLSIYAQAYGFFKGTEDVSNALKRLTEWNLDAVLSYTGGGPDAERRAAEHLARLDLMRTILGRRF